MHQVNNFVFFALTAGLPSLSQFDDATGKFLFAWVCECIVEFSLGRKV